MGANCQQSVVLQTGKLFSREHALLASGRGRLDPGRRSTKTAGGDKEGGWDVAPCQLRKRVFEDAQKAVVEGDGAVAGSGGRERQQVGGNWLGEANQEVHLMSETSALGRRDGVVIDDDTGRAWLMAKEPESAGPGEIPGSHQETVE